MIRVIEITMGVWDVVIGVLVFCCVLTIYRRDRIDRKIGSCLAIMCVNMGFQLADLLAWIFRGDTSMPGVVMTRVSNFVFFIGMGALPLAIGLYTLEIVRDSYPEAGKHLKRRLLAVSGAIVFITVVNIFTGWVYRFDELNQYYRAEGPMLYILHGLCYAAIMCIHGFAWTYRNCKHKESCRTIRIFCILTEITAIYQSAFYGISAFNAALTAGILLIFVANLQERTNLLAEKNEELVKSTEKLMQTRQKMLQLQIQPHFLFNSMAAIQALVLENQEQAYESIGTFSSLLRTGIHFSQSNDMISVEEELNFVENYTQLEVLRFGNGLDFDFDIQATGFNIPPFTIQPLVENAINHGLRPFKHKGTVYIRTYEEFFDDRMTLVIEVEDNGVGFSNGNISTLQNNERDHIGMSNVKNRIVEGCKGSFEVVSPVKADGENSERPGTLIRIRLPELKD